MKPALRPAPALRWRRPLPRLAPGSVLLVTLLLVTLSLVTLGSARAHACGACGSGDTSLTSAGSEQPFAGRLRSAMELRYRTDALGRAGIDRARIRELRTGLNLSWAPRQDLLLMAEAPLLYRRVIDDNLDRDEAWSLGDVELGAKWFILRDRPFAPRWLLAVLGGLELPSAPQLLDERGQPLSLEAQPGSGSLDAAFGPALAAFLGAFSAYVSLRWLEPLATRAPFEPGRSLRASAALQYQVAAPLALRGVSDLRWDEQSKEAREPDPNSGGGIAFAGAELLLSPLSDSTLVLGARLPVLNRLRGAHAEGPVLSLAFVQDW
jgi:hypothetical protein